MVKEGKDLVFESFEDRKSAILVGFLCLIYFGILYLPESSWIAKILPFWPPRVFLGIALVTVMLQAIVWKIFRHYYKNWYLNPTMLFLFICEFGLLLFTIIFFSWPLYLLYQYILSRQV